MSRSNFSLRSVFFHLTARLLSLFFHWLYTTLAWAYDLVAAIVSLGRWQKWVMAIRPYAIPSPTLEVGFGPGHLQEALRQQALGTYGIDLSAQMCNLTRRRMQKAGWEAKIARATVENIPFQDETFSRIVATFPSPDLFSPSSVNEIIRLLRPEGVFVVLLSVQMNGDTIPERILGGLLQITGQNLKDDLANERFLSPFRSSGLTATLNWLLCGSDELLVLFIKKPVFIIK